MVQGRLEAALSQYQQAAQALGPEHPQAEATTKKMKELDAVIKELQLQPVFGR